ncbi:MAG: helix-turn-helix domain-containing protein [Oscillospiraceae bacterium]|nr:helix-turn-helix domain-containing protein [Oscillospiraceae bacterium]MDE6102988.1 helix-turn-helix domain-containing protein [Oscillospiraceae bacterium]
MEYTSTRLKTLMKQRGISRQKLALDLNLKQEAIDQYQDNCYTADIDTLILFSDYFNVSVDYLLQRTDNPILKNK